MAKCKQFKHNSNRKHHHICNYKHISQLLPIYKNFNQCYNHLYTQFLLYLKNQSHSHHQMKYMKYHLNLNKIPDCKQGMLKTRCMLHNLINNLSIYCLHQYINWLNNFKYNYMCPIIILQIHQSIEQRKYMVIMLRCIHLYFRNFRRILFQKIYNSYFILICYLKY